MVDTSTVVHLAHRVSAQNSTRHEDYHPHSEHPNIVTRGLTQLELQVLKMKQLQDIVV